MLGGCGKGRGGSAGAVVAWLLKLLDSIRWYILGSSVCMVDITAGERVLHGVFLFCGNQCGHTFRIS